MTPATASLKNPRSILIVKLSAVGDVVHTLPALNALRTAFPSAFIGWVVQPGAANLLESHPQLDRLFVLPRRLKLGDKTLRRNIEEIKTAGPWDVAIDFQGLAKSGVVSWICGAQTRIGFGNRWSRELNWLFMNRRVSPYAVPVIEMNLGLLSPLGIHKPPAVSVLNVHPADEQKIERWAAENEVQGTRFLLLDPFAGWETKLWQWENWLGVARQCLDEFGLRPAIFHGPGERIGARELLAEMQRKNIPALLAPETTLREYTAFVMRHAACMVAADTGPMHIAAAAGAPVVALFGPSDSRRNAPAFAGARYRVLQDFTQPCAGTFTRHCNHHPPANCMDTVTPAMVMDALRDLLRGGSTGSDVQAG